MFSVSLRSIFKKVQTRQWNCWGVSCNCGVVIRDHNDVIEFNCCNGLVEQDSSTPLKVKIRREKCLSPGISIKNAKPGVDNVIYEVGLIVCVC